MRIESIIDVENRIAEIQSRIDDLTGRSPDRAWNAERASQSPFAVRLQRAMSGPPAAPGQWDSIIAEAAQEYGIDAALVKAVMTAESGGNAGARSSAGAMGLMQLMPATAESLGVTEPYDPRQNIFGGARYLKGLLERLGSPELAVAAYNAGPGAVQKYGGIPPYAETRRYVSNVMALWNRGQ